MIKKYWQFILEIINLILIIGMGTFIRYEHFYKNKKTDEIILENQSEIIENVEEPKEEKWFVDLKGAVKNPGVYEITDTSIINDVIAIAGGFNNNAYTKNINLSKKITNETVIYVYTQYEYSLLNKKEEPVKNCVCPENDLSACINSGSSVIENNEVPKDDNLDLDNEYDEDIKGNDEKSLININTANKESLMLLNGIGDAKAENIINYRTENGDFLSIEDIKNVSGISDSVYEKIKDFITI